MASMEELQTLIINYVDSKIIGETARPVCMRELHEIPAIKNMVGDDTNGRNLVNTAMSLLHKSGVVHKTTYSATKWPAIKSAIASKKAKAVGAPVINGTQHFKISKDKVEVKPMPEPTRKLIMLHILGQPATLAEARQVYQDLKDFFGE